jgi:hypothetical protein
VRCGELSVLWAPAAEGEIDAEALWRREEQLERLMEERDLLPVRFGTRVADERAAVEAVAPQGEALARALEHVRGAVEVSVRAVSRDGELPTDSGRAYLRERVAREQLAQRLHEPLSEAARDARLQDGPELLRAAYLVDRGEVPAFVALVERLQREHGELSVLCTGPWPPYSFTAP